MSAKVTNSINDAALVIQQGGVVICPSEGVYGISCSLFNEDAIKRVINNIIIIIINIILFFFFIFCIF